MTMQMELVPIELRQGLKANELFVFDTELPINESKQKHAVGEILYVKGLDPKDYGLVEYWPEHTPVAHASMFRLESIEKIEQMDGYKIITLKK